MNDSYKKQLTLDKYNLDEEVANQASNFVHWSEQYRDAQDEMYRAERDLESAKGDVNLAIREDPEKYGLDEIKEAAVKAVIMDDKNVKKLQTAFFDARKKAKILKDVKAAFEQKKIMIKVEADLWINEYYSNIEVKKSDTHEVRNKRKRKKL